MSSTARQTDPFDSFDDADDSFTQNYEAADALDLGDPFEDLPEEDLHPPVAHLDGVDLEQRRARPGLGHHATDVPR